MTRRAITSLTVLVIGVCGYVSPVGAHRLDEYLQATRVAIDADRIGLEIDLTPGANIASGIIGLLDTDKNGRISDAEADAYTRQVLAAISLSVDGQPARVSLVSRQFPQFDEMALGTGTIRLRAEAHTSPGVGSHQVVFLNTHAPETSVYLVNALVPSDPRVRIDAPHRDPIQRGLTMEFDVAPDAVRFRGVWLETASAVIGTLVISSRRRGTAHAVHRR